jgi:hypothetical protein
MSVNSIHLSYLFILKFTHLSQSVRLGVMIRKQQGQRGAIQGGDRGQHGAVSQQRLSWARI